MTDKHINLFFDLKSFINQPLDFPVIISSRKNFSIPDSSFTFFSTTIVATIHNNLREALNQNSNFLILNFKDTDIGWIVSVLDKKPTGANILFLTPCWYENGYWLTHHEPDYVLFSECEEQFNIFKLAIKNFEENKKYLDSQVLRNAKNVSEQLETVIKSKLTNLFFYYCFFFLVPEENKQSLMPYKKSFIKDTWVIIKEQIEILNRRLSEIKEELKVVKNIEKVANEAKSITEELKERFEKLKEYLPNEPKLIWEKEYKKLLYTPSQSPDYANTIEYLEIILDLPFNKYSANEIHIKDLKEILNVSHFGLGQAKESIIEHIAIQKLAGKSFGETICLVGPPGTGKTSLANKVALALDRKFMKIALGGMADESEFRGHRRTYVSSEPGRIVSGLIKCETIDPIIVFDEIDKLVTFRGSPQDALLEILDPEQNVNFIDRYLSFPVDLSKVMFICTANYIEQIPAPLKDRMSIINVEGYDQKEQFTIIKNFIIPKYSKQYNMEQNVLISDDIIEKLCQKEKIGMRDAERAIREIYKKSAYTLLSEDIQLLNLNMDNCLSAINYKLNVIDSPKPQVGFRR